MKGGSGCTSLSPVPRASPESLCSWATAETCRGTIGAVSQQAYRTQIWSCLMQALWLQLERSDCLNQFPGPREGKGLIQGHRASKRLSLIRTRPPRAMGRGDSYRRMGPSSSGTSKNSISSCSDCCCRQSLMGVQREKGSHSSIMNNQHPPLHTPSVPPSTPPAPPHLHTLAARMALIPVHTKHHYPCPIHTQQPHHSL